MNNRYGLIYESANLDNLERQILSGYITESKLIEMIREDRFNDIELDLLYRLKPQVLKTIFEASPVGIGSKLKTWGMSKVPFSSVQSTAQGRQQYAQQANALKNNFNRYLGSIGKKMNNATNGDFTAFLQKQGVDLRKSNELQNLVKNPSIPLDDASVNQTLRQVIQLQNSAPSPLPPLPATPPTQSAPVQAQNAQTNQPQVPAAPQQPQQQQPSQMNTAQVNALANALNGAMGTKNWGWANTQGLIKRLNQAGIKISV
jgi:hypothetical protein